MTATDPGAPDAAALVRRSEAPFLVWPVSRREFYMSIGVALLAPLAWGMIIFGWRVVGMLVVTVLVAILVHAVLKRFTQRGKRLVFAHSILTAMVMVGLCQPLWPGWAVAVAGGLIPIVLWALGGPGRERVHVAVAAVVILQFFVVPWVQGPTEWGEGILARDRLFMGDIRSQRQGAVTRWPTSVIIGGFDAVRIENPGAAAIGTLDKLSDFLRHTELTGDGGRTLGDTARRQIQGIFDDGLGKRLPSVEMLMTGVVPARVATASLPAIVIGGLYLAYRFILRPRSVAFFFLSFVAGMAILAIWPAAMGRLGFFGYWRVWATFPAELATLLSYAVFNSDVVFAAVFILALPGTEPLTGRGRRVFLVIAGLLGALLARMNWALPAATIGLCALMPLASKFDGWFAKRSWLNRFGL